MKLKEMPKEPKNPNKPERKVVTNAEKGLQVCGAKNKFLQPCQRIGVCPFHPPKGKETENPEGKSLDPSTPSKKRKSSEPNDHPRTEEYRDYLPPSHHEVQDYRNARSYRPIYPEDFPPPQYSRTEYFPRDFPPLHHEFRRNMHPSFPAPHFPPPISHISRPPPSAYHNEEGYYPRPYFPGSQYRRAYSDEYDEQEQRRIEEFNHFEYENRQRFTIFTPSNSLLPLKERSPEREQKENQKGKASEHEEEKELPSIKIESKVIPKKEAEDGLSSPSESLAPLLNSKNTEIEEKGLPPIWSYIRGGKLTGST